MKKLKHKKSHAKKHHEKSEHKESKKHEMKEHKAKKSKSYAKGPKAKHKIEKVMHEFKEGALHSGSKKGPVVTNPKQAIAISLSEARKASKGKKKKSK